MADFFKKLLTAYLACWRPHRGKTVSETVARFYAPKLDMALGVRLLTLALAAYLVFGFVLIPEFIKGASMEPTYSRRGFNFCWRGRYLFSEPRRGDVVIVRFTPKVSLLKRIVGLPGDTVSFRNGVLYLNGKPEKEPYVKYSCDWNLPPRTVEKDHVYVVGDNRSMPMRLHTFGAVSEKRIYGAPLW
ncbi:MAG: signal peptidase I [Victivallales bacterium]|nr:signal peptidase I [Victivallales bacterium]